MREADKEVLLLAGIDIEEAMSRFMNNEGLMMKFLLRFPEDQSFAQMKKALEEKNADEAYQAAHSLKGLAGNLAMKKLFKVASQVVDDLRKGDLQAAEKKREALEQEYQCVLKALERIGQ